MVFGHYLQSLITIDLRLCNWLMLQTWKLVSFFNVQWKYCAINRAEESFTRHEITQKNIMDWLREFYWQDIQWRRDAACFANKNVSSYFQKGGGRKHTDLLHIDVSWIKHNFRFLFISFAFPNLALCLHMFSCLLRFLRIHKVHQTALILFKAEDNDTFAAIEGFTGTLYCLLPSVNKIFINSSAHLRIISFGWASRKDATKQTERKVN